MDNLTSRSHEVHVCLKHEYSNPPLCCFTWNDPSKKQLHPPCLSNYHYCLATSLLITYASLPPYHRPYNSDILPMRVDDAAMSASEESDEPNMSSHAGHAVHDLLTDLNMPSHSNESSQLSHAQLPTWTFPSVPSARNSPSPALADTSTTGTIFSQRSISRQSSGTTHDLDPNPPIPSIQQPSLFTNPNRSIFASGPPTSSLSANTAQASMSAPSPVNSVRPLSALTVPSSSSTRRSVHYPSESKSSAKRNNRIPRAEKDVDDPSVTGERSRSAERRGNSTPTALTRLFATPEASTPTVSRHASYIRTPGGTAYTRGELPDQLVLQRC